MRLDDYKVPSTGRRVTASFQYENESLGGETSSTESAHKGIKPKQFTVNLLIDYDQPRLLGELVKIAQAVDSSGAQHIYTAVEETINACGVRNVHFDKSFRATEQDNLRAWAVSFTLTEYHSTAEKVEQRQEVKEEPPQQTAGLMEQYTLDKLTDPQFSDLLNYSNKALA